MNEDNIVLRERYIDLMERTLSAYSIDDIERYCAEVENGGLKEHGFPRLTANIGILLCHGRRKDLFDRFIWMMDFCCAQIPEVKAANDFSVKEIVFCIMELEQAGIVPCEKIDEWRKRLSGIKIEDCYNIYATAPDSKVHNWAAFTMLSEWMRGYAGLKKHDMEFIDNQAASQLQRVDENGMYRDPCEPMVYDLVTRGLMELMFYFGYNGKYRDAWEKHLKKASLLTLRMQSVTGELPYGGRSNQFLHNEAHVAFILECAARRYAELGDMEMAGRFKAGVKRALDIMEHWLTQEPIRHVKNHFPRETGYGCEDYAYFDKYMITTASFLYVCYLVSNENIHAFEPDEDRGDSYETSVHFHKLFLRGGGYFAEYDYNADHHYEASGLGRLHRRGAPGEICLSSACSRHPFYKTGASSWDALAIVPAVYCSGRWLSGTDRRAVHSVLGHRAGERSASAEIRCRMPGGENADVSYFVSSAGLDVAVTGSGRVGCLLPAFDFDGAEHAEIRFGDSILEVLYKGYVCRYRAMDGVICHTGKKAANRNGMYRVYRVEGDGKVSVNVTIVPITE